MKSEESKHYGNVGVKGIIYYCYLNEKRGNVLFYKNQPFLAP